MAKLLSEHRTRSIAWQVVGRSRLLLPHRRETIYSPTLQEWIREYRLGFSDAYVRVYATTEYGIPVHSICHRTWRIASMKRQTVQRVASLGLEPVDDRVICYLYPRLGIQCRDRDGQHRIVDIAEDVEVPLEDSLQSLPLEDVIRVFRVPEAKTRTLDEKKAHAQHSEFFRMLSRVKPTPPVNLNIELRAQTDRNNCSPAVCQMVLEHYNVLESQNVLARRMGTSNRGTWNDRPTYRHYGVNPANLDPSRNACSIEADIKKAIQNNQPVRINYGKNCETAKPKLDHAVLVVGFSVDSHGIAWLVNDPYPAKKGQVHCNERWAAICDDACETDRLEAPV